MVHRRTNRLVAVSALVLVTLTAAGCAGSSASEDGRENAVPVGCAAADESAPGAAGATLDYDPITNTSEMLPSSDIVATGTVVSSVQGAIQSEHFVYHPVVTKVTDITILAGEAEQGSDGDLYVAFGWDLPHGQIPTGTPVLIYGVGQLGRDDGMAMTDVIEGLPRNQQLYGPVHPFGLALERGHPCTPTLVFPMAQTEWKGQRLEAAFPGRDLALWLDLAG